jgi:hypothetical protein
MENRGMIPVPNATRQTHQALATGFYSVEATINNKKVISRPIYVMAGASNQFVVSRSVRIDFGGLDITSREVGMGIPLIAVYDYRLNNTPYIEEVEYQWLFIGSGNRAVTRPYFEIPPQWGRSPIIYPRVDGIYLVQVLVPGTSTVLATSGPVTVSGTELPHLDQPVALTGDQFTGGTLTASHPGVGAQAVDTSTWKWYRDGVYIPGFDGQNTFTTSVPGIYTVSVQPVDTLINQQVSPPITVQNRVRLVDRITPSTTEILVPLGATSVAPPVLSPGAGPDFRFRGWYYDNTTFANAYSTSIPLANGTTELYADWGYRPGDPRDLTRTGAGYVFYRNDGGFTLEGDPSFETYFYLEAFYTNLGPAPWLFNPVNVGTDPGFRFGMQNTEAIRALENNIFNAAGLAFSINMNPGFGTGWFLPSRAELNILADFAAIDPTFRQRFTSNAQFWASSQDSLTHAHTRMILPVGPADTRAKDFEDAYVRPIRAF